MARDIQLRCRGLNHSLFGPFLLKLVMVSMG